MTIPPPDRTNIIGIHRVGHKTGSEKLGGKSSLEGLHTPKELEGLNRPKTGSDIQFLITSNDIPEQVKSAVGNLMEVSVSKEGQKPELEMSVKEKKVKKESQIAPILKKFIKNAARVIIPIACIVAAIAFTVTLPLNPVGAAVLFIAAIAICYMLFAASLFYAIYSY